MENRNKRWATSKIPLLCEGTCPASLKTSILLSEPPKGENWLYKTVFSAGLFSVAVVNVTNESIGKRGLFTLHVTVYHGGKPRQELGGRNCSRDHGGMLPVSGFLLGSLSAAFLIQPRHPYLGMPPPIVGWASYINQQSRKGLRHAHRPSDGGNSLRCIRLTTKLTRPFSNFYTHVHLHRPSTHTIIIIKNKKC